MESVKRGLWRRESVKCEVWSDVRSLECEVESAKCEV